MTAISEVRGRGWWCGVVMLALAGSGCATLSQSPTPDYARSMAAAESALRGDDASAAVEAYRRAAEAAPAQTLPWLEIGEIQAGLADWPQAVAAAREVLHRDPDNAVARDLHLRGSLQLAGESLEYLTPAPSGADNEVRAMATGLLAGLVAKLGDEAIPAATRKRLEARSDGRPRRTVPRAAPPRVNANPQAADKPAVDPFDVLGDG